MPRKTLLAALPSGTQNNFDHWHRWRIWWVRSIARLSRRLRYNLGWQSHALPGSGSVGTMMNYTVLQYIAVACHATMHKTWLNGMIHCYGLKGIHWTLPWSRSSLHWSTCVTFRGTWADKRSWHKMHDQRLVPLLQPSRLKASARVGTGFASSTWLLGSRWLSLCEGQVWWPCHHGQVHRKFCTVAREWS